MKNVLCFLLAGAGLMACQSADEFIVSGEFPEPFSGSVYLTYVQPDSGLVKLDSVVLEGDTEFRFKRRLDNPDTYRIVTAPGKYDGEFIAEGGSQFRLSFGNELHEVSVEVQKGGKEQQLYADYAMSLGDLRERERQLNKAYEEASEQGPKGISKLDSLQQLLSAMFTEREQATREFILQHPTTYVACRLAGDLLIYTYPELEEIYSRIDTVTFARTRSFRDFYGKYADARSRWLVGRPAPEFVTRTLDGREVKLSDMRGKYVLLDFWASWCRPCRKRAAELKAVYDQLQARGIIVCGVSMDQDRTQWRTATQEDGIVWTNTGEGLPFRDNAIAAAYKVEQLPTMFLVDPEGVIVKQNPEVAELLAMPVVKE